MKTSSMSKEWKQKFAQKILNRGRDYANDGRVTDIRFEHGSIVGTVRGHRAYFVEILFSGETVTGMYCTCPYAEDGTPCKHMAAVLYAADDPPAPVVDTADDWINALEKLTIEQLRELCCSLAMDNPSVQKRILYLSSNKADPGRCEANTWKSEMEYIMNLNVADSPCDSYYGDFDYSTSDIGYDCAEELTEYTNEILERLLDENRMTDAAELLLCLFDTVCTDNDNSDAMETCRSSITEYIIDAWNELLQTADDALLTPLFERLLTQISQYTELHIRLRFINMTVDLDLTTEQFRQYLDWYDTNIEQTGHSEHIEQSIINLRLTLMECAKLPPETFVAYLESKSESDPIFQKLISYLSVCEPERAVSILRSRREVCSSHMEAAAYTRQILSVLKKKKDTEQYRQELTHLILDYGNHDIEYLSELKTLTEPGEWRDIFLQILNQKTYDYQRYELLAFEGMYDVLFLEMEDCRYLNHFLLYQKELKTIDPPRTLEIYLRLLRQDMASAGTRDQYHGLVSHLKKLKSYPNGKAAAQELARYWYSTYPRRTAMQDELKKAGYSCRD